MSTYEQSQKQNLASLGQGATFVYTVPGYRRPKLKSVHVFILDTGFNVYSM